MDDLNAVASLLAKPEPSAEAITRSRGRLQDRMTTRGRARPRRGRLLPVLGMAVAAAVAVAVIVTSVFSPAAAPVSGRDVLLMAAASAEHIPQGAGTYWHITRTWQGPDALQVQESWTTRDGHRWSRNEPYATPGSVVEDPAPFRLMGAEIGFEELEGLPADPDQLKERIAGLPRNDSAMIPADRQGALVSPLITLITELPTPAQVRSAAFEALAATPGVKNAGPVEGGQELVIPLSGSIKIRMVVDPEAARVARANILLTAEGGSAMSNSYISVTTEWTDQLPR
ncbi:CU044_5270 family protein [Nonomuraea angiospora]